MVNKCSAINCRSGYSEENKDPNVTFHAFPLKDKELLQNWLKRMARKILLLRNTQDSVHCILNPKTLLMSPQIKKTVDETRKKI